MLLVFQLIFSWLIYFGVKIPLYKEVQVLQPINLMQAIDLPKLQEKKYMEICKFQQSTYTSSFSENTASSSASPSSLNQPLLPK